MIKVFQFAKLKRKVFYERWVKDPHTRVGMNKSLVAVRTTGQGSGRRLDELGGRGWRICEMRLRVRTTDPRGKTERW
jgi:hypothetical protein